MGVKQWNPLMKQEIPSSKDQLITKHCSRDWINNLAFFTFFLKNCLQKWDGEEMKFHGKATNKQASIGNCVTNVVKIQSRFVSHSTHPPVTAILYEFRELIFKVLRKGTEPDNVAPSRSGPSLYWESASAEDRPAHFRFVALPLDGPGPDQISFGLTHPGLPFLFFVAEALG